MSNLNTNSPIGIFDSGVGGITVTREILKQLPLENLIYLGDTARVPYGPRSKEEIVTYSIELVHYLMQRKAKMLVIACNTISAVALEEIKKVSTVPVIDVTIPTINEAIKTTKNKNIGIIGTEATIESKIYEEKLHDVGITTHSLSCPLFVPIIESGSILNQSTQDVVNRYLISFNELGIDTLILGCTHYPLLLNQIEHTLNNKVIIIDSARPTALAVKKELERLGLENNEISPYHEFLVTGNEINAFRTLQHLLPDTVIDKFSKINIASSKLMHRYK